MKEKTFWPWGIILSLGLFMAGTLGFVFLSFQHRVDLVQENYYQADLDFNHRHEARQRLQGLAEQPNYHLYRDGTLELTLPDALTGANSKAELQLYNPTNPALDRKLTLSPLQKHQRVTTGPELQRQKWRLKVQYTVGSLLFYDEKVLNDPD